MKLLQNNARVQWQWHIVSCLSQFSHGDPDKGRSTYYIDDRLSRKRVYDFHLSNIFLPSDPSDCSSLFLLPQLTVLLSWNVLASLRAIVGNWQLAIVNWQFFQDSPNGRAVGHACHSTTEVLSSCFSFILLDKRFLLKLMKIDKKLSRLPASRFDNWISKSQVDTALNSFNFSLLINNFPSNLTGFFVLEL